jgi:hypothetical protein
MWPNSGLPNVRCVEADPEMDSNANPGSCHLSPGQERVFGPDHPQTLTTWNNLAVAYQKAGRLPKAIALYKRNDDAGANRRAGSRCLAARSSPPP